MAGRTVTIELPDDLYDRLEQRAAATQQSIAAEVVRVLSAAVPIDERLPSELEAELGRMETLDERALQRAARSRLTARESRRLELLHFNLQAEGLTEAEQQKEQALLRVYQRALLIRAQAFAFLKQRGFDLTRMADVRA